jgi:hypothetical protein
MAGSLRRVDRFIEDERNQGRNWRKRLDNQIYYTITGTHINSYPVLWVAFNDLQCNQVSDIVYEVNPHLHYPIFQNGAWNHHNIVHHVRNLNVIIQKIYQIWH